MSIEAMKLALEALNRSDYLGWQCNIPVMKELRAAIEQAEKQEPVAWMYDWWDESEDLDGVPTGGEICDWITKNYDEAHSPTMGCHNIRPLYTAPPQRQWQGLTHEEPMQLWEGIVKYAPSEVRINDFARAIEAKLKEKNT